MNRGFAGIGFYQYMHEENIGSAFRSAYAFGIDLLFTIGRKYRQQASDTCASTRHVPYYGYVSYDDFRQHLPKNSQIVCVELSEKAYNLENFVHPEQALYLFGNESSGIPQKILEDRYNLVVQIPTKLCLNVACTASIVIWDRISKQRKT